MGESVGAPYKHTSQSQACMRNILCAILVSVVALVEIPPDPAVACVCIARSMDRDILHQLVVFNTVSACGMRWTGCQQNQRDQDLADLDRSVETLSDPMIGDGLQKSAKTIQYLQMLRCACSVAQGGKVQLVQHNDAARAFLSIQFSLFGPFLISSAGFGSDWIGKLVMIMAVAGVGEGGSVRRKKTNRRAVVAIFSSQGNADNLCESVFVWLKCLLPRKKHSHFGGCEHGISTWGRGDYLLARGDRLP